MDKEIGGYFSLELHSSNQYIPAFEGIHLNTGRNSIEYILRSLKNVNKLLIPYYTCDSVLEPIEKLGIEYEFYSINIDLEIDSEIVLGEYDYLLYTNYFGIKDGYVGILNKKYGNRLIVDNAQALFAEPTVLCAYSPRKFIGIPDGGMAFTADKPDIQMEQSISYDICSHLLKRIDCGGNSAYTDFRANCKSLSRQPIKRMSRLTETILESVNLQEVISVRNNNFNYLHLRLHDTNKLKVPLAGTFACPMVYPYYVEKDDLRKKLIDSKIYVATYWPNVFDWCMNDSTEYKLAKYILPLPVDQRYGIEDMERIIEQIKC